MEKQSFVYIMSNKNRTTLYIGVTNNLEVHVLQHKTGQSNFTKKYNLFDLIYFERTIGMQHAIEREKQLKNWHKEWKWNLIKEQNPDLIDQAADWFTREDIETCRKSSKETE